MPELPEVECVRQGILSAFQGKQIAKVWTRDALRLLDPQSVPLSRLAKCVLVAVERRGKYLRWDFGKYQLIAHLGMTGVWQADGNRQKHTRVEFTFADGSSLSYTDPRQFGYLCVMEGATPSKRWEALGPDAVSREWTAASFYTVTRSSRVEIKVCLMDQRKVAGIGNIYASEALFRAHVHPRRIAQSLSREECTAIVREAKRVMRLSIENRGTTFSDYRLTNGKGGAFQGFLRVFQKPGAPCPVCHAPIQQIVQCGRSTFFCAQCQK